MFLAPIIGCVRWSRGAGGEGMLSHCVCVYVYMLLGKGMCRAWKGRKGLEKGGKEGGARKA